MTNRIAKPMADPQDVLERLSAYDRAPFMEELARFLGCAPTEAAIQRLANDDPKAWAHAVRTLANMAGFAERREIETNVYVQIANMSDAELMARMKVVDGQLLDAGVIEGDRAVRGGEDVGREDHAGDPPAPQLGQEQEPNR